MTKPNVIHLEHVYAHAPAAVWKALTDPTLHARWWAAGDVKPMVGNRFELDMGTWGKQPWHAAHAHARRFRPRFTDGATGARGDGEGVAGFAVGNGEGASAGLGDMRALFPRSD